MIFLNPSPSSRRARAFTLIEMVAVIAIIVILMTAGVSLLSGTGAQARRTGTDVLIGMIEQARTTAITSRSNVILAIAEPGDLPAGDERCRIGLFRIDNWPDRTTDPFQGVLLTRWRTLETGVVLIPGQVDGVENPMDADQITLTYGTENKPLTVEVHALAFNPRGGLLHPPGSAPVVMRVAEGTYRNGEAKPIRRSGDNTFAENRLKIGRVTARPYRTDG